MIPFVKTQALGNDFILVEQTSKIPPDYSSLGKRICHRYFGVGADGLILWMPSGGTFKRRTINREAGEAERSGNGFARLAAYLIEPGGGQKDEIGLKTIQGM